LSKFISDCVSSITNKNGTHTVVKKVDFFGVPTMSVNG